MDLAGPWGLFGRAVGVLWKGLGRILRDLGLSSGVLGGLQGGLGGPKQNILIFTTKTKALGPSRGVQGGTRDAPRMHRGCTKDAPSGKYGGSVKAKGGFFLKSRAEMVVFRCFLQKCTAPKREA